MKPPRPKAIDVFAVECLKDQVGNTSRRYVRLRAAVLDCLEALPSDKDVYLRRLRHEVGRWDESTEVVALEVAG